MTDARLQHITRVLESAQAPTQIGDTRTWLLRLWCCAQGSGVADEHDGDILFHQVLQVMADSNAEGRIAAECLPAALAAARRAIGPRENAA